MKMKKNVNVNQSEGVIICETTFDISRQDPISLRKDWVF